MLKWSNLADISMCDNVRRNSVLSHVVEGKVSAIPIQNHEGFRFSFAMSGILWLCQAKLEKSL